MTPPPQAFPSTRWSRILAAPGERDLEQLARAYHRPIRAWLAAELRLSPDATDDLCQDAFAWMLSTRLFDRADPARGRFRAFLKTALRRFAIERWRHDAAQKRGGDRVHVSLDAADAPALAGGRTPDQELDAAWRRELLEQACARLRQELEDGGRGVRFRLFSAWYLEPEDPPLDHAALAARHGITRTDVANWLDHAKRRYRALLRDLVRDTVGDDEALQAELRWLFGPDGAGQP